MGTKESEYAGKKDYSLKKLFPKNNSEICTVKTKSKIREAITVMMQEDYSQLPVVEHGNVVGSLSWRSIVEKAMLYGNWNLERKVKEYMDSNFMIVDEEENIVDVIKKVGKYDYVIISNGNNKIKSIVTNYDIIESYKKFVGPYMLLGVIEDSIREVIARLPDKEIREVLQYNKDHRVGDGVDAMTFGDYTKILEKDKYLNEMGLESFDKESLRRKMSKIGKIRNKVMHFRIDRDELELSNLENYVEFWCKVKSAIIDGAS